MRDALLTLLSHPWSRARAVVLVAASAVYLLALGSDGVGNPYYAAVVRTGLDNGLLSLLTGTLDANGFAAIDKPPLTVLPQYLSASVLGFNGAALSLPYAAAGIACIALVMAITRRTLGDHASVWAGVLTAAAPVSSIVFLQPVPDAVNLLGMLLATYAVLRAWSDGRARWIALAGAGFLLAAGTKVSMFLPLALVLVLVLAARPGRLSQRLGLAGGLAAAAAAALLAWPTWFDFAPGTRPTLGSSPDGTAMGVVLRYNLWDRTPFGDSPLYFFDDASYHGASLLRMLQAGYADEWAWLAVPALVGLGVLAAAAVRLRGRSARAAAAAVARHRAFPGVAIMLGWAASYWAVLSYSGATVCCQHAYYSAVLVPPAAFFAALGITWSLRRPLTALLLTAGIAVAGVWQFAQGANGALWFAAATYLTPGSTLEYQNLSVLVLAVTAALAVAASAAGVLLVSRGHRTRGRRLQAAAVALALLPMLAVTAVNVLSPQQARAGGDPRSGRLSVPFTPPGPLAQHQLPGGLVVRDVGTAAYSLPDVPADLALLISQENPQARWGAAMLTAYQAGAMQLASGRPILSYGGTRGYDEPLTLEQFLELVAAGDMPTALVSASDFCQLEPRLGFTADRGHEPARILAWVLEHGQRSVPPTAAAGSPWYPAVYELAPETAAAQLRGGIPPSKAVQSAAASTDDSWQSDLPHCR